MKPLTITVLLCFFALTSCAESDFEEAAKNLQSCLQEIGIKPGTKDITPIQNKCGIACVLKSLKMMNQDGSINVDAVVANSRGVTQKDVQNYIEICRKQVGENVDPKVYHCEMAVCLQENDFLMSV